MGGVLCQTSDIKEFDGPKHHYTAREYRDEFRKRDMAAFESFHSFVSMRNPWERYVSLFNFGRPDEYLRMFWDKGYFPVKPATFDYWISEKWDQLGNLQYFADIDNSPAVKEIIMLENYIEAVPNLLDRLGLKQEKIPHNNGGRGKPQIYQQWYNRDSRKLVEKCCQREIEIGGYTFAGGFRKYSGATKYA